MKIINNILVAALAINFGLLVPQLSAALMSDKEARAEFQQQLDHAKQLLADGEWKSLVAEARELQDTSQSFERRPDETEKGHKKMHDAIKQHATKLAAAAGDENRKEATEHYNELAACFHVKAKRGNVAVDNTEKNVRDRDSQTLTPLDQGNSQADLNTTAKIRKEIMADGNMSVNAKNVKIITNKGQVTLRGPVNTVEEKRLIGEIANRIARSANVDNQLEVKITTSSNN